MATESILMAAVAAGGDRQELHEHIRVHSQAAAYEVKAEGRPNDLMQRIADDPAFKGIKLDELLEPIEFVGRAPQQVDDFIAEVVQPILNASRDSAVAISAEVRV